jgi:glutathione S-transferase
MYTLYFLPGACSVAIQAVLHQLDQDVKIINVNKIDNFKDINPVGAVPVLVDGDTILKEGAAILLHLLEKHKSSMLPTSGAARQKAIHDLMFANSTMHTAYGRLFFIGNSISDEKAKHEALNAAAQQINALWLIVESELGNNDFLGGDQVSTADFFLAIYSTWGAYFPVDIVIGKKSTALIDRVQALASYQKAITAQQAESA